MSTPTFGWCRDWHSQATTNKLGSNGDRQTQGTEPAEIGLHRFKGLNKSCQQVLQEYIQPAEADAMAVDTKKQYI